MEEPQAAKRLRYGVRCQLAAREQRGPDTCTCECHNVDSQLRSISRGYWSTEDADLLRRITRDHWLDC